MKLWFVLYIASGIYGVAGPVKEYPTLKDCAAYTQTTPSRDEILAKFGITKWTTHDYALPDGAVVTFANDITIKCEEHAEAPTITGPTYNPTIPGRVP